jgi:hypothetical protein
MPEIGTVQSGLAKVVGSVPASTQGTTITTGSANVKGSYVELTSATANDANWVLVHLGNAASAGSNHLVDIAIGAATEQVIIPDLNMMSKAAGANFGSYLFPIFIPAGSRLTARAQGPAATTLEVVLTLFSGTMLAGGAPPSIVSAYGAVASSLGTAIDGVTANTEGAWTQIAAATDRDHCWWCVSGRIGDATLAAVTRWMIDLGIDTATETEIVGDLYFTADITSDLPYNPVVCFPYFVPAGSRITARMRSNVATSGDRVANIKLYGA